MVVDAAGRLALGAGRLNLEEEVEPLGPSAGEGVAGVVEDELGVDPEVVGGWVAPGDVRAAFVARMVDRPGRYEGAASDDLSLA